MATGARPESLLIPSTSQIAGRGGEMEGMGWRVRGWISGGHGMEGEGVDQWWRAL